MTIYVPTRPRIKFGTIEVTPPPGAFLQATQHGEYSLQQTVAEILDGHNYIADLFAGCGTLSLPLIDQISGLLAVESDISALAALKTGVDASGRGSRLTTQDRNLFDVPLLPEELAKTSGVIIDPQEVAPSLNVKISAIQMSQLLPWYLVIRQVLPEMPPV